MSQIQVELGSIEHAIATMRTKVVDEITRLRGDFATFRASVHPSDWSSEPACQGFGQSYCAALEVYEQVIAGMEADVTRYTQALADAHREYAASDDRSLDAMNRVLARLDVGNRSAESTLGRAQFRAHDEPQLISDDPRAAPSSAAANPAPAATTGQAAPAHARLG